MFTRLLFLFTLLPLLELGLLIKVGEHIGALNTIAIVLLTGIAGASLARTQGFHIINRIRDELSQGHVPTESLLDGVLVLAGGLLLLTPGLVTDTFGFLILIPFTRAVLKNYLRRYFKSKLDSGEFTAHYTVEE